MSEPQFAIRSFENGRVVLRRPRPGEVDELRRRGESDRLVQVGERALAAGEREAFLERTQGDRPLTAGVEAFGNVLSGGALSEIQRGLDPTAGLEAEERLERNPGSAFVGAAIGAVAPGVAARSAGTLGALASLTGPGATSRLGLAAEQQIARALLERGLSSRGSRAIGSILGTAAEGAADGALLSLEQSLVQNDDLTAERLLSNVGLGAFLGLGIGAGIEGTRLVVGRGRQAVANRLAQQAEEGGLLGTGSVLREGEFEGFWGNTVGRLGFGRQSDLAIMSQRAGRRMAREGASDLNVAIRNTAEATTSYRRLLNENLESATSRAERFVSEQSFEDLAVAGERSVTDSIVSLDVLRNSGRVTTDAARKALTDARNILARAAIGEATSAQDVVSRLNAAVEGLGTIRRPRDVTGQGVEQVTEALRNIDQVRRQLSGLTRDPGLVGPAGEILNEVRELQRAYRAAEADLLDKFGSEVVEDGSRVLEIDGRRLNRVFQESSDVRSDASIQSISDFLEAGDQLRESLTRLGLADDALATVGEENAQAIRRYLQEGFDRVRSIQAFGGALTTERGEAGFSIASGIGPSAFGAGVGGAFGGPVGALAGAATAAIFRPASFFALLGNLEGGVAKMLGRQQRSFGRLRSTLRGSGRGLRTAGGPGTRKIPALVMRLRDPEERRREYRDLVDEIRELAVSPEILETRLATVGGPELAQEMPDLHALMSAKAVMALQYLHSTLPPASVPGMFDHLTDTTPSLSEMDVFVRRFHAIEDPLSIVDRAADLTLTVEEVEAVAAVYPELYSMIQAQTTEIISDLDSLPPYQARINIGNLMRIPADESLDPSFVMRMQRTAAQTRQQDQAQISQSRSRSINVAGDTYSESQQVALRL